MDEKKIIDFILSVTKNVTERNFKFISIEVNNLGFFWTHFIEFKHKNVTLIFGITKKRRLEIIDKDNYSKLVKQKFEEQFSGFLAE